MFPRGIGSQPALERSVAKAKPDYILREVTHQEGARLENKMARIFTRICDSFFDRFSFRPRKSSQYRLHFLLIFLFFFASVYPIFSYSLLKNDLHVSYWLGALPIITNLSVPILLFFLLLSIFLL